MCINTLDKEPEYPLHEFQRTSDILHLAGAEWVSKFKGDVSKLKKGWPGRRRKWKKAGIVHEKLPEPSKTRSEAQKKKRSICKQACKKRQASLEDRSNTFAKKAKQNLKELLSAGKSYKYPVTETETVTKDHEFESSGSPNIEEDTVKTRPPHQKRPPSLGKHGNHKNMGEAKDRNKLSKVPL